jgi:acyl-CoA thioester hydrolase
MSQAAEAATEFSRFRHWSEVPVRFGDLDGQGHVNNAAFAALFEMGRVEIFYGSANLVDTSENIFVLKEITISFERELRWPALTRIGTAVSHIGSSSVVMEQVMLSAGELCARARVVNVFVSRRLSRPWPLPDPLRAHLAAYS